jgi:hypothetical protein
VEAIYKVVDCLRNGHILPGVGNLLGVLLYL